MKKTKINIFYITFVHFLLQFRIIIRSCKSTTNRIIKWFKEKESQMQRTIEKNRDANFRIFKIYYSKFKRYMTLTRFVKKFSKLGMRIFTSQKIRFSKYILFDERLLQKQNNQITTFIFSKFTSHFEIIGIKTEIILCVWKDKIWTRTWTRLERKFERDSSANLIENLNSHYNKQLDCNVEKIFIRLILIKYNNTFFSKFQFISIYVF